MNSEKVEQTLKQIFDSYGKDILRERRRFEGAVLDLLDERNYAQEIIVLRHAIDSTALWQLVQSPQLSEDAAGKAVTQLQQESRMTEADARFITRCAVAACGGDPNIVRKSEAQPKLQNWNGRNRLEKETKQEKKNQQDSAKHQRQTYPEQDKKWENGQKKQQPKIVRVEVLPSLKEKAEYFVGELALVLFKGVVMTTILLLSGIFIDSPVFIVGILGILGYCISFWMFKEGLVSCVKGTDISACIIYEYDEKGNLKNERKEHKAVLYTIPALLKMFFFVGGGIIWVVLFGKFLQLI